MGKFPFQARNFWVAKPGRDLWEGVGLDQIDKEIREVENQTNDVVFDTVGLPWFHTRNILSIWLESSLESRVKKAIVSHRGKTGMTPDQLRTLIRSKDLTLASYFKTAYGFDVVRDREVFDVILEVSTCIHEATLEASWCSISQVQQVIDPILGWYLTRQDQFRDRFKDISSNATNVKVLRAPKELYLH